MSSTTVAATPTPIARCHGLDVEWARHFFCKHFSMRRENLKSTDPDRAQTGNPNPQRLGHVLAALAKVGGGRDFFTPLISALMERMP